ncbi:cell division control protein [Hortaea werneckii]|nr:cell division control protein [Hortaea werneckii]KAI6811519.1 cell division control protein [Hortaea werneckii]KAI6922400.1 cell division control protein [Hortaea werneckii]KAI6931875.1 cell division control protein [Hortaea werneckii]KAI6966219.1 cell division control protein [Hortaea werneckii]
MSAVLGKRTRAAVDTPGTKEPIPCNGAACAGTNEVADKVSTRSSKRRIVVNEPNDENANPFVHHDDHHVAAGNDEMEVEEQERPVKKTRTSTRTVPAKHGASERRVVVSPAKVRDHFHTSKPEIREDADGKNDSSKASPQTPRRRDAQARKVPITPRHRVLLGGGQPSPRTPRTPATPSNGTTAVYNQARQLFSRCSAPGRLVGRDSERHELNTFVERCVESESAGCLYVSGPPGTGKSALVDEVVRQYTDSEHLQLAVVNCMSVRNAKDLSQKLSEDLGLKKDATFSYLRSCFTQAKVGGEKKFLVILDEVDTLVDLDLDLLYNLFEWSMQPSSRLVLLGIANALDLTDRFLPRLKGRNLKPELLPFMPYNAAQIAEVLTTKLRSLQEAEMAAVPFLQPAAIQFCAKKVASQTGDLRKAFDICRRAIDMVALETAEKDAEKALQDSPSKTPLMENVNLSSPTTPRSPTKCPEKNRPTTTHTLETAPKATIAHMARVTAQVFGNGTIQRLATLNLQQKAVLCSLGALEKRKRETQVEKTMFSTPSKQRNNDSAPTIKQLYDAYTSLCKREKLLHPLTSVEFRDVVSGLETLSLILPVDGRNGSFVVPITPSKTPGRRGGAGKGNGFVGGLGATTSGDEKRVSSGVGYKELAGALEGAGAELLREILDGDGLF